MSSHLQETRRRRTFAIVSHPDAGKTTLTEKLLLFGGAIQMAGSVKGRKAARHATSDWMALEKEEESLLLPDEGINPCLCAPREHRVSTTGQSLFGHAIPP